MLDIDFLVNFGYAACGAGIVLTIIVYIMAHTEEEKSDDKT